MTAMLEVSDGTAIAYRRTGDGPVLVLVHGGLTDSRCFDPVVERLSDLTTVTYDRRGHGASGDAPSYSLEREAADLVELARHAGAGDDVCVLAYSYGALVTLHAMTAMRPPFRAVVLYEPPFATGGMLAAEDATLELIHAGRHDEAASLFVGSTFLLSDSALRAMRAHAMWDVAVRLVHTLPRELAAIRAVPFPPAPVPSAPPTRVLVAAQGGNPAFLHIASAIAGALPGCDIRPVPGLPHFAMPTEPDAFVKAVREHLDRHAGR